MAADLLAIDPGWLAGATATSVADHVELDQQPDRQDDQITDGRHLHQPVEETIDSPTNASRRMPTSA
jgi:hypothetical protein